MQSDLLEVISKEELPVEQQIRWRNVDIVHRLRREPTDISEFKHYEGLVAIINDNGTAALIHPRLFRIIGLPFNEKSLSLTFYGDERKCAMTCAITGFTDKAVAETAALFWSLGHAESSNPSLTIRSHDNYGDGVFDFRAVQPEQLARMFERNPTRNVVFSYLKISAFQSTVLATRTHPVHLRFGCFCAIEDDGDALASTLSNRQSPIGSLNFSAVNCSDDRVWLSDVNLKRLFQIPFIDELILDGCFSDDLIPFLFASPISTIRLDDCHGQITQRIHIAPDVLSLELSCGQVYPTHSLFSYLSYLGHRELTKLSVFLGCNDDAQDKDIQELIRFIGARPDLQVLKWSSPLRSAELMRDLFAVVEQHKGLRTFQIVDFPYKMDRHHEFLANLIKRNRVIRVVDSDGELLINGNEMHHTHSLNRFYCGLPNLGHESPAIRPALVKEALMHSAKRDFQRGALLLAKQTDSLYQLVRSVPADLPTSDDGDNRMTQASAPNLPEVNSSERKREASCCCDHSCKRAKI
ncbi:hypothetical protein FisN_10Lu350 [Fistulifera solaris]|jgi:hypothetical protein|uniref:Uncharacterized protein n=1 Tax=Fistulifera solaris TaxID=1519565 RepID=A0A1Z5KFQ6_FISSO|nr:hypothetical protein FisN_10Lu350 [Fistulifera solaris]|eukprot:GAX25123.1 hypothetical protein FisN_10Lu350 [Fistulifera solaris]